MNSLIGSLKSAEQIPLILRGHPQWVTWSADRNPKDAERVIKCPYTAHNASVRASVTDPSSWGSFDIALTALNRHRDVFETRSNNANHPDLFGLGFVLTEDDPFVGVDLDNAIDPATGEIRCWAQDIVENLESYTEVSPSGTGLRIFVIGNIPVPGKRKGNHTTGAIELYQSGRYLTVTGDRING